jgi:cyclase
VPPDAAPPEPFTWEIVEEGVWAGFATIGGAALCNVGLIDLGGVLVGYDAGLTPQAGAELARHARQETGRTIDFLVDSHYHGDHIRGNAAAAPKFVVGTETTRRLILERGRPHLRSDREEAARALPRLRDGTSHVPAADRPLYEGWFSWLVETPEDLEFRPPELTVERELTVHGPRRSVRILSFGGGHSPSDTFVFLPASKTAFLGDLLSIRFHPAVADGNLPAWRRILEEIEALGPQRLVPGHGPVGTPRDLRVMRQYLDGLAAPTPQAGESAAVVPEIPEPFRTWGFSSFYAENCAFARSSQPAPG